MTTPTEQTVGVNVVIDGSKTPMRDPRTARQMWDAIQDQYRVTVTAPITVEMLDNARWAFSGNTRRGANALFVTAQDYAALVRNASDFGFVKTTSASDFNRGFAGLARELEVWTDMFGDKFLPRGEFAVCITPQP